MKNRLLLLAATLFTLLLAVAPTTPMASAHAASLRFVRGYSLQGSWLCYGWSNGAYHCTQRHNGYHSLNPSWVPNGLGSQPARPAAQSAGEHEPDGCDGDEACAPAAARPAVSFSKPARNPYPYGQCTWGAYQLAHDNVGGLGNANTWLSRARSRGMATGSTPHVGATVTYAPGVQGASWLGHVAHVVRVGANGSFEVQEMNYYGFGGGFGRFSYRWSHTGWGVNFIY